MNDAHNYPTLSEKDLRIADLERENEAAFERIQELGAELVRLGFDPTAKTQTADSVWIACEILPGIGDEIAPGIYVAETYCGTDGKKYRVQTIPPIGAD